MKKTIFFLGLAFAMSEATLASADSYNYKPYAGVSYSYATAHAKSAKPKYNIGGIYVGSEYGKYFSTELFYNQSTGDKNHLNGIKTKTSYRSYGLDLLGYLPIDCNNRFDLIATIGAGEYVFAKKIKGEKHHNNSAWGYRFGGGLKYNLTQNWQARTLVRYVNFDRISDFDHQIEYSAGVEYHF